MVTVMCRKPHGDGHYRDAEREVDVMGNNLKSRGPARIAADRSAYVRTLQRKLAEKHAALDLVKRRVSRAVAAGRITRSNQLVNAERRADGCLLAAENWIARLSSDADDAWEDSRLSTDIALEELSRSVKQMVARFT